MHRIYFDHSATTPTDPLVIEAMLPYLKDRFGNPSSIHAFGREANVALEAAREKVAKLITAQANEIYFTSGGTESDNMAIKGIASSLKNKGNHIITSKIEHHAVLHTCQYLESIGYRLTYLTPDDKGMIDPEAVEAAITDQTILITIMHANNEVGTINPIERIGHIARAHGVLFHTDAVQTFGKLPIDVSGQPLNLMSFSSHKIYGPKGVGGLYLRKGIQLDKLFHGGAHERNRRAGTENIPGIIGFARAAELCGERMEKDHEQMRLLSEALFKGITHRISRVHHNGHPTERLPGILNLTFEGIEGESLLLNLDLKGVAASSGSACTSGTTDPSHVLLGMGIKPELAQSSIRFSLGRGNSMEDIDFVVNMLTEIVQRLRSMSPLM